ncbi:MAG TPA: hypothetical protein VFI93_03665 [Rhizomicrobium sp.]|nr:hypothetical protein [Rhizomicrobium sp.]
MAPISPTEAADTLRNIETAERHSSVAYGYRMTAPHLILWGVIWFIGYGGTWLRPDLGYVWPVLASIGAIGSFAIGYGMAPKAGQRDYRHVLIFFAVFAFIAAQLAILKPINNMQIGAYFPILVAFYYALLGIWIRGTRLLLLGIATSVLTLAAYFWMPQYFLPWMAIVGGGALLLGGLWLRRA